ncbi:hypothetical protein O0A22_11535 [Staphylococcus pseudintermedius]|nr:hypothetical protein [Staphylococcus pseudintermedius]
MMKKLLPFTIAGVLLSACGNESDKKEETKKEKTESVEKKKEESKKDTAEKENKTDTQNEQQSPVQQDVISQEQQESTPPENYETWYNHDGEFYNSLTDEEFEQMKRNARAERENAKPSQWVQDQIDWANSSEAERVEMQKETAKENGVEYNPKDFQP